MTDYCGKYHEMCAGNSYLCQAKNVSETKSCAFYEEVKNHNQCANINRGQCNVHTRSKRIEIKNMEITIIVFLMIICVVVVSVFMVTTSRQGEARNNENSVQR